KGWPEEAPFDAIIVSAGGPKVPRALEDQLKVGGCLVVPVGEEYAQRLKRIVRNSDADFEEEDQGAVAFVPLIAEEGWKEPAAGRPSPVSPKTLAQRIGNAAEPLPAFDDP